MLEDSTPVIGPYGHDFTELANHLRSLRGRVVYIPNPGNAGDAVIITGLFSFLNRIGMVPELGSDRHVYPDAHVIYPGGGKLVPNYRKGWKCLEAHIGNCRSFTVLPHSIRSGEDILKKLDENFFLFARDLTTRRHLGDRIGGPNVMLSHDMAFANDFSEFQIPYSSAPMFQHPAYDEVSFWSRGALKSLWRLRMLRNRVRGSRLPTEGTLNAFRTDSESSQAFELPSDNIDLSRHLAFARAPSPFMMSVIAHRFVQIIDQFDTVRTDRLHVALTAALLGKKVEAWDNSYGKLGDVISHSLANYPNITLHPRNSKEAP